MRSFKLACVPLLIAVLAGCAGGPAATGHFGREHAVFESEVTRRAEAGAVDSWYITLAGRMPVFRFRYEIAAWPGFKDSAYSITFDDGTLDQYLLAFPALEKRMLKATFYIITGPRDEGFWNDSGAMRALFSWEQAREMAAAGHEMGSHTATHRDLSAVSASRADLIEKELLESIDAIRREIPAYNEAAPNTGRLSFAWPYWRSGAQAGDLVDRYFIGARSGNSSVESYLSKPERALYKTPKDFLAIPAVTMRANDTEETLLTLRTATEHAGGWNILSFHGIDDGRIEADALGWDPCPLVRFEAILDALYSMNSWTAPVGTVIRYVKERDAASVTLAAVEGDRMLLHLIDGLNENEYGIPLSLRFNLPAGWGDVRVIRKGEPLPSRTEAGWCTVEVVPDGEILTVERTAP
jgi:peptidoglycan/xylan/chitin deacetylase (PgdA/CDA1 family)